MMNNKRDMTIHLFVVRSYRKSFQGSLDFLFTNIKTFFQSLWQPCLFVGLVLALLFVVIRVSSNTLIIAECGVSLLLILLALAIIYKIVAQMVFQYNETNELKPFYLKKNFGKVFRESLNIFFLFVLEFAIFILLTYGTFIVSIKNFYVWILLLFVCMILIVPFALAQGAILISNKSFFKSIKSGLIFCKHYFGSTLILLILSGLVDGIVFIILYLPLIILNLSISASNHALSIGDPSDLPFSVYVIHFILTLVLMSVFVFCLLIPILSKIFHYGSVIRNEQERQKIEH